MSGTLLASFVPVAKSCHFPVQNLPYGVFRPNAAASPRVGVAIGEFVLDVSVIAKSGLLQPSEHISDFSCFSKDALNDFMAMGRPAWKHIRSELQRLLSVDEPSLRDNDELRRQALIPLSDVQMELPARIGDFTDFYSSRPHAERCTRIFRGADAQLSANWLNMPIAYHSRTSSIQLSGTPVIRPKGQLAPPESPGALPPFGACQKLDYELEVGFLIGPGNQHGQSIQVDAAMDHIFGLVICNDWSARDIQLFEYQPLGPFLSKSFATSISPWVVTMEALEPFRCPAVEQNPKPLPYLTATDRLSFDIKLQADVVAKGHSEDSSVKPSTTTCVSNFKHLYWSMEQQVAHHTINGCPLRSGDLLSSGTVSGPEEDSAACLLELTLNGTRPFTLTAAAAGGRELSCSRSFLEDGDEVIMTAFCEAGDGQRLGFGECRGEITPSR